MVTKKNGKVRLSLKTFLISIALWFAVCLIFHLTVQAIERHKKNKLIKAGISISKDISSQSGLPLLEKKFEHLSMLIDNITKRPGVVFASIIDHKNKIIAYSDQDQFFSLNSKNAKESDGVKYWRILNLESHNVMNFSTQITFSDTRVGEVFISLATENIDSFQHYYLMFAILSFLCIIIIFGFANFKNILIWIQKREHFTEEPLGGVVAAGEEKTLFTCPLCGTAKPLSNNTCNNTSPESAAVLVHYTDKKRTVLLNDLDQFEELSWIKKRIVSRCAKIITAITT